MKMKWGIIAGVLGGIAAAEAGGSAYFYRRTMMRYNAKKERTMKMSGVDWESYYSFMKPRGEWMRAQAHEDVWIRSDDGLRLHATYFPGIDGGNPDKAVICFHGYTSEGMSDYSSITNYYLKKGNTMLLLDARARNGIRIVLMGNSMGGATVLMASGLNLPEQVKGIVSDCAFTSPKAVFTHVLHSMYHLPAFPMIQIADFVNRKMAGYGLDECNAAKEVQKAKLPILFIHGDKDTFVPCSMCDELYASCASQKTKLIVKGAGHCESYYKNTKAFEDALDKFLEGVMR